MAGYNTTGRVRTEERRTAAEPARGGFLEDGLGYDLWNHAKEFGGSFAEAVNEAASGLIRAASDVPGTASALASAAMQAALSPIETGSRLYDDAVAATTDAFDQIAAGGAASVAGRLAGGAALGLATGGAGAAGTTALRQAALRALRSNLVPDPRVLRQLFTNEELDALVRSGDLSPEIAQKAKRLGMNIELSELRDGAFIAQLTPKELVDRLLSKAKVQGSDEFKEKLRADLEKIAEDPQGRQNLETLLDTDKQVTFIEHPDYMASVRNDGNVMTTRGGPDSAFREANGPYGHPGDPIDVVGPGPGADAKIYYDPNKPLGSPVAGGLAHEVQHGANQVLGVGTVNVTTPDLLSGFPNLEELSAVTAENSMYGTLGTDLVRQDYWEFPPGRALDP